MQSTEYASSLLKSIRRLAVRFRDDDLAPGRFRKLVTRLSTQRLRSFCVQEIRKLPGFQMLRSIPELKGKTRELANLIVTRMSNRIDRAIAKEPKDNVARPDHLSSELVKLVPECFEEVSKAFAPRTPRESSI